MFILESVLLTALLIWFAFFLTNHSTLCAPLRAVLAPIAPNWLQKAVTCPFCFGWWALLAAAPFTGLSLMNLLGPVAVLFVDLTYRRLAGSEGGK